MLRACWCGGLLIRLSLEIWKFHHDTAYPTILFWLGTHIALYRGEVEA